MHGLSDKSQSSASKNIEERILSWQELHNKCDHWRSLNETIVFTNGCFDLVHYGHVQYLAQARHLGNRLIVALNSSESIRKLKGSGRPIQDELSRLYIMASFRFVDAVVIFNDPTPENLIKFIRPDILVKGGDWHPEQIAGSEFILSTGGKVLSLPFVEGYSTTKLEEKIKKNR